MARSISLNGQSYSIPQTGDSGWSGTGGVDDYLVALSTGVLTKAGGAFTMSAEVDLGANYSIAGAYFKSRVQSATTTATTTSSSPTVTVTSATGIAVGQSVTGTGIAAGTVVSTVSGTTVTLSANATASGSGVSLTFTSNPAAAGIVRLANADTISFRNAANSSDLILGVNSSGQLVFNGSVIQTAGNYITDLTGDVTATGPGSAAATVAQVGGLAAASVAAGSTLANNATDANTASALVKRDASGNFSAGTITANLTGNVTGNASGTAANVTGVVAPANGGTGVANNAANTITFSGAYALALTLSAATALTLPTTGTLATVSGALGTPASITLTNGTGLSLTTGVTGVLPTANGGTGQNSTATFPTSGTVLTDTNTVTVSGKTLTSPTITTPTQTSYQDLTEVSTPSAPGSGKLRVYAKTDDQLYVQTSAGVEKAVGSGGGSGSGQKNYIASTAQSTAAGWTASGAGITVTTDTTAADLPRATTTGSGIKLTGVSGSTAYAYVRFTLDAADYNVKQQVQFAMNALSGYASGDMRLDVYSNTASDYSGTSTRLTMPTDVSSITSLPAKEGTFQTSFDSPGASAKWLELRIGLNSANTHSLVISDLIVGPGVVVQGAAVSSWQSYTPTITGFGTATSASFWYQRVGDDVFVRGTFTTGTSAASSATISLPNGWNVNTAAFGTGYNNAAGAWFRDTAGSATDSGSMLLNSVTPTNVIAFGKAQAVSGVSPLARANGSDIAGTSEGISVWFRVPVAELAGSGTVNVAQNDVEYAYNTGNVTAAGGSDTTSFGYGPGGTSILAYASTTASSFTSFTVQFQTPIQATDLLTVEIYDGHGWEPAASRLPFVKQNTASYGVALTMTSSTQVNILFGNNGADGSASSFGGNSGTAWSALAGSGWKWRVRKQTAGAAVGFGKANNTASGLVSYESSGTFTASFTGARTTTATCSWYRTGKNVTLVIPTNKNAAATSAAAFSAAASTMPADIIPGVTFYAPIFIQDNNGDNNTPGYVQIGSDGSLVIGKTYSSAAFTNSANCGFYQTHISYTVA